MRIFPFPGTRYAPQAGDPGRLAAPPFDQIDEAMRSRLQAEPRQFAHLTRPDPAARPDPWRHAAELHRGWLAAGIVRRDEASFYPYEIVLPGGGRRLGLAALVGLEPPEAEIVRPHEQTVGKTVAERLELLQAIGCDLEPILLLSDDGGALEDALNGAIEGGEAVAEYADPDGNLHRLYRQSAAAVDSYRPLLADRTAVIADGHHRWEVARRHAAATAAAPGAPAATKLAVLTSLESTGLTIDPIHRGLAAAADADAAAGLAAHRESWSGGRGRDFAAAVAVAPQPAVGLVARGRPPEIWTLPTASSPSPARSALAVCRLHAELLPRLGAPAGADTDGGLVYRSDPDRLWDEVAGGELALGCWLPPMSPRDFGRALAEGGLLPPKSTRFLPKLASGLVWFDHRSG